MTNGKTLQIHYYLGQLISIINKNAKNKSELKDVAVKNATTNDILTTVKTVPNILLIGVEVEHQSLSKNERPGVIGLKEAKEIVKAIDACPEGCVLLIKEVGPNQFKTLVVPDIENARHYLKTNKQESLTDSINQENAVVTEDENKTGNNTNKDNTAGKDNNQQSQNNQDNKDSKDKNYNYMNEEEYKKVIDELLKATDKKERAEKVLTFRNVMWKLAKGGAMVVGAITIVTVFVKTMVEAVRSIVQQGTEAAREMATSLYTAVTGNPVLTQEDLTTIINQLTKTSNQLSNSAGSGADTPVVHTASFNLFGTIKNFLTEWFSITNALGDEIFGKASATGDIFGFALGVFGLFAIIALSVRLFRSLFKFGFRESYIIRETEQQHPQQTVQQAIPKQRKFGLFAAVSVILVAMFTKLAKGASLLGKIASTMLIGVLNIFSKRKTEAINLKEMFVQIKEFLKTLFRLIPATAMTIVGAFLRFAKGGLLGIINFIKRHEQYNANTITADDKRIALEMGMKTSVLAK